MSLAADIAYIREGGGDALVLIHGVGHRHQAWTPVLPALTRRFDVIALDLPGFGESPAVRDEPRAYDMASTIGRLRRFFDELGLDRPHVAGNSLGGALALELGAQGVVRSVTAISPAGYWATVRQRHVALTMLRMHRTLAGVPDILGRRIAASPRLRAQTARFIYAHPERVDPQIFFDDARAMHDCAGFEGTLEHGLSYVCDARPTVPTTLVWGTDDKILPFTQSLLARERMPDAAFVPLAGAGHVPMYDDPDGVVSAIVTTTERVPARAARRPRPVR